MEKTLIIGASGHAKVIIETIELNNNYEIYGLIDTFKPKGSKLLRYEVLGKEEDIPSLIKQGIRKGIIAIGDNWVRYQMYLKIKKIAPDFEFINVIHPSVVISPSVILGEGSVILASVTINAEAQVGDFCILNTGVNLGHDSIMKEFSSLAPGATIGGNVYIGKGTAISLGANIIQGITVGNYSVVGAGSVIVNNIDDYKLAYGVPAKEIRTFKKGERYLSGLWGEEKKKS
ncbi:sugar O-acyltransferase (sialic acid O-acetyltransferase NeuD family) [Aquimarina sp. MAR_2010_214]|uniref:acetyltransferase n=1 Tax=Aquimarina sp. MAR_2010_214 TaxID=1250026 RepID=UPI000C6FD946|nr:acetyltransferase [Aquimarina sp. MAR_2010_214]PKV50994.1 sugar O-acyltransferase (sialic acid O-acetyltransferase NeuD family) [Aquimarina sp. MAR_2010_214]